MLTMGRWKDAVVLENSIDKFQIFRIESYYFYQIKRIDTEIILAEISKLSGKVSKPGFEPGNFFVTCERYAN